MRARLLEETTITTETVSNALRVRRLSAINAAITTTNSKGASSEVSIQASNNENDSDSWVNIEGAVGSVNGNCTVMINADVAAYSFIRVKFDFVKGSSTATAVISGNEMSIK